MTYQFICMLTNYKPFSEKVTSKAVALKITPKLLLILIIGIAESSDVADRVLLLRYGKALAVDMRNQAKEQAETGDKDSKKAGEAALNRMDGMYSQIIRGTEIIDMPNAEELTEEFEAPLNLHMLAWNIMASEIKTIQLKYSFTANSLKLADIFKTICPDLIEECRIIGILMNPRILQLSKKLLKRNTPKPIKQYI